MQKLQEKEEKEEEVERRSSGMSLSMIDQPVGPNQANLVVCATTCEGRAQQARQSCKQTIVGPTRATGELAEAFGRTGEPRCSDRQLSELGGPALAEQRWSRALINQAACRGRRVRFDLIGSELRCEQ